MACSLLSLGAAEGAATDGGMRVGLSPSGTQRLIGYDFHAIRAAGIERIDYAEIADPITLQTLETVQNSARALIAAHVGKTRLIDNLSL